MKRTSMLTGVFVVVTILLFGIGLFLIGDRHKAFNRHVAFEASMMDVEGLLPGGKVRVSGYDAGQISTIEIPRKPSEKFRIVMQVQERLRPLIRKDSLVSVESDGLVGDKFLLIHAGTDQTAMAMPGDMLPSKEQVELSVVVAKVNGLLDQASGTMADVSHHIDGTLDTLKGTIENTNGLVTGMRDGKGTVGMLLSDESTAQQVRAAIGNTRQATEEFDQIMSKANLLVTHANEMVSDLESRDLPEKAQQTLDNVKNASVQLNHASTQLNQALTGALASDATGVDAAQNIRESLSNVNTATANLADDSEALKHEFFFRGFFRKRGFYTLSTLSPDEYRSETFFTNSSNERKWLSASDMFVELPDDRQALSPAGTALLDSFGAEAKDSISGKALVIEGYASNAAPSKQLLVSKTRAGLVKRYLEQHFQVNPTNIGIVPLNAAAPPNTGKATWDGVCVVILERKK